MAQQSKCWWACDRCGHEVWRGIVTGIDRPCPRCGCDQLTPSGGSNKRAAVKIHSQRTER